MILAINSGGDDLSALIDNGFESEGLEVTLVSNELMPAVLFSPLDAGEIGYVFAEVEVNGEETITLRDSL